MKNATSLADVVVGTLRLTNVAVTVLAAGLLGGPWAAVLTFGLIGIFNTKGFKLS